MSERGGGMSMNDSQAAARALGDLVTEQRKRIAELEAEVERLRQLATGYEQQIVDLKRPRNFGDVRTALEAMEAEVERLLVLLDVPCRKLRYLIRDYPGDKETREWLASIEALRPRIEAAHERALGLEP